MSDHEKLKQLIVDTFLLDEEEFSLDLRKDDVDTWDSLGVVALAVAVEQVFGYHLKPEEATSLASVADLVVILKREGVQFDS